MLTLRRTLQARQMSNFFDDDDEQDTLNDNILAQPSRRANGQSIAGPSRGQARAASRRATSPDDGERPSKSPSLPPPLRAHTPDSAAAAGASKGKARAGDDGAAYGRHARGVSVQMDAGGGDDEDEDEDEDEEDNAAHYAQPAARRPPQQQQQRARPHHPAIQRNGAKPRRTAQDSFLADDVDEHDDFDPTADLDRDDAAAAGGGQNDNGDGAKKEKETKVQRLVRAYMDERQAPELLPYPEELVHSLMAHLENQTEAASVLVTSGMSAQAEQHEQLLLVQMEIERVRWLLRSYLRARTFKIEQQSSYLLRTPLAKLKMSDVEQGYAERYDALVKRHFQSAVTGNIPERLGRLDEDEMIIRPDLDQAVFAQARKDCPSIQLPDGQSLRMLAGEIHLVRYRSIRRLLRDGHVRLV